MCSRSSVLRTPSSPVRTAVAAAEAAVRGPVEEERRCALACEEEGGANWLGLL